MAYNMIGQLIVVRVDYEVDCATPQSLCRWQRSTIEALLVATIGYNLQVVLIALVLTAADHY